MLFAHLKQILRLDRLHLRGPHGARDELHLAATAQNPEEARQAHPHAATQAGMRGASPLTLVFSRERRVPTRTLGDFFNSIGPAKAHGNRLPGTVLKGGLGAFRILGDHTVRGINCIQPRTQPTAAAAHGIRGCALGRSLDR